MADNKIPVLTEVYKPKKSKKAEASTETLQLTPELIAQIAKQVKVDQEGGAAASDVEALRADVAQLQEKLAAALEVNKAMASDADAANEKLRDEVSALQEQLTASHKENESTAAGTAETASEAVETLRAEVNTLQEQLAASHEASQSTAAGAAETASETIETLRAEQAAIRDELTASTNSLSEQIAQASSGDAAAELAQSLGAQIKPRLEAEITDFALDEVRAEIKKAHDDIIESTAGFVDKTKADLKTEMPRMYQKSIDLAQVDLTESFEKLQADTNAEVETAMAAVKEALQEVESKQQQLINEHHSELTVTFEALKKEVQENLSEAVNTEITALQEKAMEEHKGQLNAALAGFLQIQGEDAEQTLLRKMQDYQEKLHIDYQEKLTGQVADALETIKERVEESTEEQIGIMHSQVGTIQQETFAKLRQDFSAERDLVFTDAANEIRTTFAEKMTEESHEINEQFLAKVNGNLPEVQQVLQDNIQAILDKAIPELEDGLREELTNEIKSLLQQVKFVLPD